MDVWCTTTDTPSTRSTPCTVHAENKYSSHRRNSTDVFSDPSLIIGKHKFGSIRERFASRSITSNSPVKNDAKVIPHVFDACHKKDFCQLVEKFSSLGSHPNNVINVHSKHLPQAPAKGNHGNSEHGYRAILSHHAHGSFDDLAIDPPDLGVQARRQSELTISCVSESSMMHSTDSNTDCRCNAFCLTGSLSSRTFEKDACLNEFETVWNNHKPNCVQGTRHQDRYFDESCCQQNANAKTENIAEISIDSLVCKSAIMSEINSSMVSSLDDKNTLFKNEYGDFLCQESIHLSEDDAVLKCMDTSNNDDVSSQKYVDVGEKIFVSTSLTLCNTEKTSISHNSKNSILSSKNVSKMLNDNDINHIGLLDMELPIQPKAVYDKEIADECCLEKFSIVGNTTMLRSRDDVSASANNVGLAKKPGLCKSHSVDSSLHRTQSYFRKFGKCVLKNTNSMTLDDSSIDPQLAYIMQQRRRLLEQNVDADQCMEEVFCLRDSFDYDVTLPSCSKFRMSSAPEEIRSKMSLTRESQTSDSIVIHEEISVPVSQRILNLQTKINECDKPVMPTISRNKSSANHGSISFLCENGCSEVDETTTKDGHSLNYEVANGDTVVNADGCPIDRPHNGESTSHSCQLSIQGLNDEGTKSSDNQQFSLQKQHRQHWRMRTQPVTVDEVYEADKHKLLSEFKSQLPRKNESNTFGQVKLNSNEQKVLNNMDVSQHMHCGKQHRHRFERRKTLPLTTEGESIDCKPMTDNIDLWICDSQADSGILSGSELESLGSESLRNLCLEMEVSDNDPCNLSVSSKAILFRSFDERSKANNKENKSASGAKRYIERKKRERCQTQPVTTEEVKTAASASDLPGMIYTGKAKHMPKLDVINRSKSLNEQYQVNDDESDHLLKLSLTEKVKLFSEKQQIDLLLSGGKEPTDLHSSTLHLSRRRQHPSRFKTQPFTTEELKDAFKISPLAMTLVKPPDKELLIGLKVKDQQDIMVKHAEKTLSNYSSRQCSLTSSCASSVSSTDTVLQDFEVVDTSVDTIFNSPTCAANDQNVKAFDIKHQSVIRSHSDVSSMDKLPDSVLMKSKSSENMYYDKVESLRLINDFEDSERKNYEFKMQHNVAPLIEPNLSLIKQDLHADFFNEAKHVLTLEGTSLNEESSTDFAHAGCGSSDIKEKTINHLILYDDSLINESSTDTMLVNNVNTNIKNMEQLDYVKIKYDRNSQTERISPVERHNTKIASCLTSKKCPRVRRHDEEQCSTQPVTPEEMKEASLVTAPNTNGGSISDRLNLLKINGEEAWRARINRPKFMDIPSFNVNGQQEVGSGEGRDSDQGKVVERLGELEVSSERWKSRVGEHDANEFTVANKLCSQSGHKLLSGLESPLVARIHALSQKSFPDIDADSELSTDFMNTDLRQLHKETFVGTAETDRVLVPVDDINLEEIDRFFCTKQLSEIVDKVEMDVDDFNNIFIESNEILKPVRKLRPARKRKSAARNPLKAMSTFIDIQSTYIQSSDKDHRIASSCVLKPASGFALEALAGLASKENFSQVELRKTNNSSPFAAVANSYSPFSDLMLLHVKGRRNVQTRLVNPSSTSMNSGDCYILVTPDRLIVWVGQYSNVIEKAKAAEVACIIQQKRDMCYRSSSLVETVYQVKDHLGVGRKFWAALKGDRGDCQACGPCEEDELYESSVIKTNMVYRFADSALLPHEAYWGRMPSHEMLDKKEVFVFDFGSEFYVWHGKAVSQQDRRQSLSLARRLCCRGYDYTECALNPLSPLRAESPSKSTERPGWAIFGKINQNMETVLFREKFSDWPDMSRLIRVKEDKSKRESLVLNAYDVKLMIHPNADPVTMVLEGAHVGRGRKWQEDMQGFVKMKEIVTLSVMVWHVLEYDRYRLDCRSHGQFHSGDTYVVRWQYMFFNAGLRSLKGSQSTRHSLQGREHCAYFFWQGQGSSINEKGASALMTVELDEERGPQVRVVQGKEPPCFLNLFDGGMVVHIGKREDASTNTIGVWRLYCIRGDEEREACLLEIPVCVSNLRSRSSLLLLDTHTGTIFVWHGARSPPHVRRLAGVTAKRIQARRPCCCEQHVMFEGSPCCGDQFEVDAYSCLSLPGVRRPLELVLHDDAHVTIIEMEEGDEEPEIWLALGGEDRSLYHCLLTSETCPGRTLRLFHMSSVSLMFEVSEQMNPSRLPGVVTQFPFLQSDLYRTSQPALCLVDAGPVIYLWQGWWPIGDGEVVNVHTGSAAARFNDDRRCALETTLNYCKEQGQDSECPTAYVVCAGVEPLAFQNLFPHWQPDLTVAGLALEEGKQDGYCVLVEDVYTYLTQSCHSLEHLQHRPLPDGVNPLMLESYLSDCDFEAVLGIKKDEFYSLQSWKQHDMKSAVGLF